MPDLAGFTSGGMDSDEGLQVGVRTRELMTHRDDYIQDFVPAGPRVTLIAGGDIEWSRVVKAPEVYLGDSKIFHGSRRPETWWERIIRIGGIKKCERIWIRGMRKLRRGAGQHWSNVPYLATAKGSAQLKGEKGLRSAPSKRHYDEAIQFGLTFDSDEERDRYPFRKIRTLLREADIAFANLETPLSDEARYSGDFRAPTAFARALSWAGLDAVSTANNHALDAEGAGLLDTMDALQQAKIGAIGTGRNLADARRPFIIERKGIKVERRTGYDDGVGGGYRSYPSASSMDKFDSSERYQKC